MSESEDNSTLFPLAREDDPVDGYGDDEDYDRDRDPGHRDRVLGAIAGFMKTRNGRKR